jgi:benzil reductase ((S)-benzoin forming)
VADVIVWITGATGGIGAGLAASVPYPNAEIVNLSRREVAGLINVRVDLTDPGQWSRVADDFAARLATFQGRLALFIHNALYASRFGFVGDMTADEASRQAIANCAAPFVLANAFAACCSAKFESGIVLISSAGGETAMAGQAIYCASKAGMEHWARTVAREHETRGRGPWAIAIRPGGVNTPAVQHAAEMSVEDLAIAPRLKEMLSSGTHNLLDPLTAGQEIWAAIEQRAANGAVIDLRPEWDRKFASRASQAPGPV